MQAIWNWIDEFDGFFNVVVILVWWCVVWPSFIAGSIDMLSSRGIESFRAKVHHTLFWKRDQQR